MLVARFLYCTEKKERKKLKKILYRDLSHSHRSPVFPIQIAGYGPLSAAGTDALKHLEKTYKMLLHEMSNIQMATKSDETLESAAPPPAMHENPRGFHHLWSPFVLSTMKY